MDENEKKEVEVIVEVVPVEEVATEDTVVVPETAPAAAPDTLTIGG